MTDNPPQLWLPAHALDCYEGDEALRSWLTTPGLLTQRVREACGAAYRLRVVREGRSEGEHVRVIELGTDEAVWVYAETHMPQPTLARHAWLAHIGDRSLGEALADHSGVSRTAFEYGRMMADTPLVARAVAHARVPPQPLWVRRFNFLVEGLPLTVSEAFLPVVSERREALRV